MGIFTEVRKTESIITYEHNMVNTEKHLAEAEAEVRVCREVIEIVKKNAD